MKRLLKYAISFLVVVLLFPMTTNAQTIKRPKQKTKTEKTQKQNNQSPAKKRATNEFEGLTANQIAKIGLDYEFGMHGKTQDYTKAVKWYRKAAELGDDWAQWKMGECYKDGRGVAKDYYEAVKWYRKSAEQGHPWHQCTLGDCYYNGFGVTQDYYEAAKWYRKAANQGNEFGQISLAKCYYYGHGVTKNLDEAKSLLLKAIAQGSNDAKTYMRNWFGE